MKVKFDQKTYCFRECDTKGMTQEELQEKADKEGRMQYEPRMKWLEIPGIGYGWEE